MGTVEWIKIGVWNILCVAINIHQFWAAIEFANHFISITCTLNGRKVMTCILKKPKKGEDLTFLTFLNHKWLASVQ